MLLGGDIGGTKTVLAAYPVDGNPREAIYETRYASMEYPDLETIIQQFLKTYPDLSIKTAAFGVAGPVIRGKASITNLPWSIEERKIRETFGFTSVLLLNDLTAIANAVPVLQSDELFTLHANEPEPKGNIAIIAPGTGLGEAFLTWQNHHYHAHPSEGGHASFAPTNAREVNLLSYLMERYGHVSYERVCSGIGIPNIYAFLKENVNVDEPAWLTKQLADAEDPTPVIITAALATDPSAYAEICAATLDTFISILGTESGNLAVKVMATGGIYLGGGIPPRILSALKGKRFLRALHNKGRFSKMVVRIPVHVIMNPNAALLGTAVYGLRMIH